MMQENEITVILAHGYPSERAQRKLSNKYQHDRVLRVSKIFAFLWNLFWSFQLTLFTFPILCCFIRSTLPKSVWHISLCDTSFNHFAFYIVWFCTNNNIIEFLHPHIIPMTLYKDIMPYFFINLYMFTVETWVYCGPTQKFGRPNILQ